MCTLALYFRIFDDCPIVLAANRDEHYDRPSALPSLLNTKPAIVAGRDLRAGGTWLGVNDTGLLAGILNRRSGGEQSPRPGVRSRGLLCLDLLGFNNGAEARAFISAHDLSYQPFTLICSDGHEAWAAFNDDQGIHTQTLDRGLHVFSSAAEFDARSEKAERAYARFAEVEEELKIKSGQPMHWLRILQSVLSDHRWGNGSDDPRDAICVHGEVSGTVSSSVVLYSRSERRFRTYFCPAAPCKSAFGEALTLKVH